VITVLLVDDHPILRQGLAGILSMEDDIEVVGEAVNGEAAVAVAPTLRPDVIIMDLRLPGIPGSIAIQQILTQADESSAQSAETDWYPRVIVLTTYEDDDSITDAIEAGATGYLLKSATPDEIVAAIRATNDGHSMLAPSVAAALVRKMRAGDTGRLLSPRETEVMKLLVEGLSNVEIAAQLSLEASTVKTHVEHIYAKLGVSRRVQAIARARELGLGR